MLKLDGIATFVAIAGAGSISEAARQLRLSKSVVSERLADLERGLDTTLVHRTTRGLSLTDDGAAFLERAIRIGHDVADAVTDLAERRGTLSGPLRISAPVSLGRLHLGPALYPFLVKHPHIELTLELNARRVDAAAEGYDAVVRHGIIEDTRLMVWRLAVSQRVLVASPDYLARHGAPSSLADLRRHRAIHYTNRGGEDWRFRTAVGIDVVRGLLGLRVNNGDMMRDAAIAGIGIALLPSFIIGDAVKVGELVVLDVGAAAEVEYIYMAHPEGRRPSAKLRAVAECLREALAAAED